MRSLQACYLALFYAVLAVVVSRDTNVGAKLTASLSIIGPSWIGVVLAGAVVSKLDWIIYKSNPATSCPQCNIYVLQVCLL